MIIKRLWFCRRDSSQTVHRVSIMEREKNGWRQIFPARPKKKTKINIWLDVIRILLSIRPLAFVTKTISAPGWGCLQSMVQLYRKCWEKAACLSAQHEAIVTYTGGQKDGWVWQTAKMKLINKAASVSCFIFSPLRKGANHVGGGWKGAVMGGGVTSFIFHILGEPSSALLSFTHARRSE